MVVILRMTRHEGDTFVFAGKQVGISLFGFSKDLEIGVVADKRCREISIAGMRGQERIIESTRQ